MSLKTSESTGRRPAAPPAPAAPAAARSDEADPAEDGFTSLHESLPEGPPRVLIESEESGVQLNLGEVWDYRELLYFLTLRDIKVRYKQTLMGAVWVIIQPLMMMLIVTLVFNRFARLDAGSMPYPLFAYSGLLIWTFFASGVTNGTNSLVSNSNLITKVYFPRMFIPAAAVGAGLFDLCIASLLLLALVVYYGVAFTWELLLLPVFVLLATVLALGVGMMVAALTVKYRDLRHALPFVIQFLMFASPVIYPSSIVPERWRWILVVNPLTGILEGFRAALVGQRIEWTLVAASAVVSTALLALAVYVFRRAEDSFADVI
jgi:lipopolysaccharide transport system permease protein